MDDAALVESWRSGDNQAGRRLIARYYEPIYRFFYGKVSDGSARI